MNLYYAAEIRLEETGELIYEHPFFHADSRVLAIDHAMSCAAGDTGYDFGEMTVKLIRNWSRVDPGGTVTIHRIKPGTWVERLALAKKQEAALTRALRRPRDWNGQDGCSE